VIFGQNTGKTRFLAVFGLKRPFSAFSASRAQGFYINPSRRGPAVPGGGSPGPGGALKLRGAEVPPLGVGALLAELGKGIYRTSAGTGKHRLKSQNLPILYLTYHVPHPRGPGRPGEPLRIVASEASTGDRREPRGPAARG